jgi:5-methylcytosine-specific restriction endonuclease McrA
MEQKVKFELERMAVRDDPSLISEMQRVSNLVLSGPLTIKAFDKHSKIHSSTLRKRFGSWKNALEKAGLADRFDDSNRPRSKEELISEIQQIAERVGISEFTRDRYIAESGAYGSVIREFGFWRNALRAAGLPQRKAGLRYTDEECFENLFAVWMHYGRAPQNNEMKLPPSTVGPKAYVLRWGTWLKALEAFVEEANADSEHCKSVPVPLETSTATVVSLEPRAIPAGTRYRVLIRDRARCVLCGRTPATELTIELHIDHIIPWSMGGSNQEENLRVLCKDCNLGKRDDIEFLPLS